MRHLHRVSARNFLSLGKVDVDLAPLNVLVGPNGAGKTNFLKIIQFLGDAARHDLGPAIARHGGYGSLLFRGPRTRGGIELSVQCKVTTHASDSAPDEYKLSFQDKKSLLTRHETFTFKRTKGRGRRITVRGVRAEIEDLDASTSEPQPLAKGASNAEQQSLAKGSLGLSTLRRLGERQGANQVADLANLFETFRIFEVDVAAARRPVARPAVGPTNVQLAADASNLAFFLEWLSRSEADVFAQLVDDLRYITPGIKDIHLRPVGGSVDAVAVEIEEAALSGRTPLAAASFGTVRALALLAVLHDPHPPRLTSIEEIDHGLHPHALDRIVERLRNASERRTQLLVATHSPALVSRLDPDELIVCERDLQSGATRMPAISPREVEEMAQASNLSLGELWFSGTLGGVLP